MYILHFSDMLEIFNVKRVQYGNCKFHFNNNNI